MVATLEGSDVRIDARPDESNMPGFLSVLFPVPYLLFIGVWIFSCAKCRAEDAVVRWAGKSRAKMLTEHHGRVTFEDVAE